MHTFSMSLLQYHQPRRGGGRERSQEGGEKGVKESRACRGASPVTPVDVVLKHGDGKHVHVVSAENHLTVLTSLKVNALNLVCTDT